MGCKTRRVGLRRAKTSLNDGGRRHRHRSMEASHTACAAIRGSSRPTVQTACITGWCRRLEAARASAAK